MQSDNSLNSLRLYIVLTIFGLLVAIVQFGINQDHEKRLNSLETKLQDLRLPTVAQLPDYDYSPAPVYLSLQDAESANDNGPADEQAFKKLKVAVEYYALLSKKESDAQQRYPSPPGSSKLHPEVEKAHLRLYYTSYVIHENYAKLNLQQKELAEKQIPVPALHLGVGTSDTGIFAKEGVGLFKTFVQTTFSDPDYLSMFSISQEDSTALGEEVTDKIDQLAKNQ